MAWNTQALGEGQTSLLQEWDRDYRLLWAEHQSLRSHYAHAENRWPDSLLLGAQTDVSMRPLLAQSFATGGKA